MQFVRLQSLAADPGKLTEIFSFARIGVTSLGVLVSLACNIFYDKSDLSPGTSREATTVCVSRDVAGFSEAIVDGTQPGYVNRFGDAGPAMRRVRGLAHRHCPMRGYRF